MSTVPIDIRISTRADAATLTCLHQDAWRYAYRGIIPAVTLEKMIQRRDVRWWERMHRVGGQALLLEFDHEVAGYATFGPNRVRKLALGGEIYELYLKPQYQGVGFGKRLFKEARRRMRERGYTGHLVWSLGANESACRFYEALGGKEHARTIEALSGLKFEKIAFVWR